MTETYDTGIAYKKSLFKFPHVFENFKIWNVDVSENQSCSEMLI